MDQTLLFPSPNWYQSSGLAVSNDGWLVYGGPSKSLCVMEPLPADSNTLVCGNQAYQAHVALRAHSEKISCVDISPEWPEKKAVLTGSADGTVKQWSLERTQKTLNMKTTHSHEIHSNEKEEVIGVGYCKDGYAVTVGCYGYIVKWDMNSNVVKTFNKILNNFRPVCMACSPHIHLNVAIGTKQGVIFVLDLNGAARVLYKVKGQDDEILKVGWCPQYEVAVRKLLKESEKKSVATQRMERIRKEPESPETLKMLDEKVKQSCGDQAVDVQEPSTSSDQTDQTAKEKSLNTEIQTTKTPLNESGMGKILPEDSFDDQSVVQEEDMFDIYKEPDLEEFGHKKYQPVDIVVKFKEEVVQDDYLAECLKLKDEIIKKKNHDEASIESLVEAMDKTELDVKKNEAKEGAANQNAAKVVVEGKITKGEVESSVHIQKHLLATVGKYGSVRIWSKSGKLVGSCAIPNAGFNKNQRNQRGTPHWCNLLWYKSEVLLLVDGKSQLLECNPLKIDCKNKLEYRVFPTLHKRGLTNLATNAPRVQPPEMPADKSHDDSWLVWTAAQDRTLIAYSMKKQKPPAVYSTCGGFVYKIVPCPYDAKKVAIAVGDGEVRVWESDTLDDDDTKMSSGTVTSYSHNVQGKVLNVAWHPTVENVLAFSTGEARVGIIDASAAGKQPRPARPFPPLLRGGVYALAWAEGWDLYACGGGELALFKGNATDEPPKAIPVELEGRKLDLSSVTYHPQGLVVGSCDGAVAVLSTTRPHVVQAAAFVFAKMIHSIVWHPQETSNSSEESMYKNLIAVCSVDRVNTIVILEYGIKEDGTKQLTTWKTLSGHKGAVLDLAWNPHMEGILLSTSSDSTVRVWAAASGACTAIFDGHVQAALGAAWSARPQRACLVASGGADAALRLWDAANHPSEAYQERPDQKRDRKKKDKKTKEDNKKDDEEETEGHEAAVMDTKMKGCKKFLLPMLFKQTNTCKANGPRVMLKKYLEKLSGNAIDGGMETVEYDLDFIKLFGNINEINDVLDVELEWHQDTGNVEAWLMLCIFRGYIDAMIQYASQKDLLDPYLISLAPSVSFKYWKDATQLYLAQIDRLVAKGEEGKLSENRRYGGAIYRKTATLLSLHDIKGALAVLCEAQLFLEAYVLCRVRYMESLAEEVLLLWGEYLTLHGRFNMAAVCYINLGNVSQAATVLGKSKEEESLSLAAELAKLVGQTTYADHIEAKKKEVIKIKQEMEKNYEKPEEIQALPTRVELVLNKAPDQSDSESYKDSEKDAKSDIVPEFDVEESAGPSGMCKQDVDNERNKIDLEADHERDLSKTAQNDKVSVQIGEENATDVEKDKNNETDECLKHSVIDINVAKDDENKVQVVVENVNEDQVLNGKEAPNNDKTDELLEELPSKMKDLMSENMYQNGNVQNGKANENKAGAIAKDASDINDNINERGDHLIVTDTDN